MIPEIGLLETLVNLASLGTSGICIFAIFWIGWLLRKSTATQDVERQRSLRFFMVVCILISLISAGAGLWGGHIDAQEFASLKEWKGEYETRKQWYVVKGTVRKDDDLDPGDIKITTHFPPLSPGGSGNISGLRVRRDYEGNLPSLGFSCPDYVDEGLDLDTQDLTNNVIDIGTVTLHRLP